MLTGGAWIPEGSWRALGGLRVLRAGMGYWCVKLSLLNSVFLTHNMCGPLRKAAVVISWKKSGRCLPWGGGGGGDVALGELLEGSRRAPSAPCRNGLYVCEIVIVLPLIPVDLLGEAAGNIS